MSTREPPELRLKPGKERSLERRHPWIYASAVARVAGTPAAGETVCVRAADGRFLAWAGFSPQSLIRARVWSFEQSDRVDADWLAARLQRALARRERLRLRTDAMRLVFGESDGLPGLVVDRYRDLLVVQFLSAAVEAWRGPIVDALVRLTGCDDVYERSDAQFRRREALPPATGALHGSAPRAPVDIVEDGVRYRVDALAGHKTGFYLDQRDNRLRVAREAARLATERDRVRVLNCFAYTGGFAIAALAAGASHALSIDSSADALALAARNATLNGIAASAAETWASDVFDALRSLRDAGRRFELIVLDPPKFAPAAAHVQRAARAYKEINLKALGLLEPGGLLFTFSCSGAIGIELFQKIVAGAVIDSGADMLLLARLGAGEDHPMSMAHPEGEYLKGLLLERA
ncbi:MAG: class I SAM-dependent methyltransferase [Burkholderiales bacterium]|nr:MAG: class I SAM-dependent methyltransferase [Burkholderiales bacterium]